MKRLEDMTEFELRRLMNALASNVVKTAASMGAEMIEAMRETADRLDRGEDVLR